MVGILFVAGLVLLVPGAESLVRGASKLASSLGVPPLLVGLTAVVYGTSTPEVAVSLQAAMAGQADIAIGNVVGSNIFNVLFILGLSAIITPLVVSRQLVQIRRPAGGRRVGRHAAHGARRPDSRLDGAILAALIVVYTGFLVRQALEGANGEPGRRGGGRGRGGGASARHNGAHMGRATSRTSPPGWACSCWAPGGSWSRPSRLRG